jgi:hypothetical protein
LRAAIARTVGKSEGWVSTRALNKLNPVAAGVRGLPDDSDSGTDGGREASPHRRGERDDFDDISQGICPLHTIRNSDSESSYDELPIHESDASDDEFGYLAGYQRPVQFYSAVANNLETDPTARILRDAVSDLEHDILDFERSGHTPP